jgi:predicted TPR repeat methyltransferase
MAYLKLRRAIELAVLDRPGLSRLFRPRGGEASRKAPAAQWDDLYARGAYDNLLDSDKRHHHRLLSALVAERAPQARILEVGCGQGAFYQSLRTFRPRRYLGTDISSRAIDLARERFAREVASGQAEFRVSDGSQLTSEERFDAIVFADCIEYLGPVEDVVARYASQLAPGGFFALTQWLALHPLGIWRRMGAVTEILDEAVVSAPFGGAWQVWTCRPLNTSDG